MRNSRRSSADCAQQPPPDGCATDRTTEPTAENTIGTLPPRRPGASPGSPGHPGHPGHPNYPEYPEHPEHPEHPGAAPPPDCNRRTGKGRAFGRFSLLLWSGKRNSHSRCARAVPRISADTPGPWKGRFEVAGAESLMHRHTKAKGRISEDSPFCFGAENGTRTRAARERFANTGRHPRPLEGAF